MSTHTKFSRLSLATKIRLHEKFTSEIFYRRKYPNLWYLATSLRLLDTYFHIIRHIFAIKPILLCLPKCLMLGAFRI